MSSTASGGGAVEDGCSPSNTHPKTAKHQSARSVRISAAVSLGAHSIGLATIPLGVPFYATLHQLMTLPLTIRGAVVHVRENPAVLRRAAGELGAGSAPLLCTEGRPSAAFHQLADVVVSGGR